MRIELFHIRNVQMTGRVVPYEFQKVQWKIRSGEGKKNTEKKLTGLQARGKGRANRSLIVFKHRERGLRPSFPVPSNT
jgi:hypothetical protein